MQVYFKNSFVSIFYDPDAKLGKAVWKGRLQGPELREAYLLILDVIDRFNLTYWLADNRLMESINEEDLKWSLEYYVPQVTNSSLKKVARLPSQSLENCRAIDQMIVKGQEYNPNLEIEDFTNEGEALKWLYSNSNKIYLQE